jgi:twitching motility protein PilT
MQIPEFELLLREMIKNGASDLHLKTNSVPLFRINGKLFQVDYPKLTPQDTAQLTNELCSTPRLQKAKDEEGSADFAYMCPGVGRFRINVFRQRSTYDIACRAIKLTIPSVKELHLEENVMNYLATMERGMVLLTGTAGSGKSTTLAVLVNLINTNRFDHILTIEDPIEYMHNNKKSVVSQREVGTDCPSFQDALEHALRQDPDVILVGEIRDQETMQVTMGIAETGHVVLSTLHTYNCAQAVDRMLDFYPPNLHNQVRKQISNTLQAVICQRLIPRADGKGRVPAMEIMVATAAVRKLINEGKINELQQAIQNGEMGNQTFNQSLVKLYKEGLIDLDTGLLYSDDPAGFRRNISGGYADSDRKGIVF